MAAIGGEDKPAGGGVDLGDGKKTVYLMERQPAWGCVATPGRGGEMEDACAAVPRFADVPVRLLARCRELDGLGLDADALRLPSHLFAVFDGHGSAEVSNYCQERLHDVVSKELSRPPEDLGEMSDVDMKEHWDELFTRCFERVDGEVSGLVDGEPPLEPIAAENVGSTAVAAVVCSSHVVVANCGDSRVVLSRGKEAMALSTDHKLILASDGLWDVVTNEEACKVARKQIRKRHKNKCVTPSSSDGGDGSTDPAAQAAADSLVRLALKKGSRDNISVIVVDLKPRGKP